MAERRAAALAGAIVVLAGVGVVLAGTVASASVLAGSGALVLADEGATAGESTLTGAFSPASADATSEERQSGLARIDTSSPTRIDSCTTITEPGEYVLSRDVRNGSPTDPQMGLGACIEIRADDVLLDGAGHTVAAGPNGTPGVVGVLVGARARPSNVTVRNLTTTRWGAGVAVVGAENATLLNVSAVRNLGDGFFVEDAPGATIRGGVVRESNTGVFVRSAPSATIASLTVEENIAGVSVRRSDGATVRGIEANRNRQYGVGVFSSADATVADSVFRSNSFAGVALAQSDARLRNLTILPDSPGWAVYAVRDSTAIGERVRLDETTVSFEASDVALDSADGVPPLPLTERQAVGSPLFALPTSEDPRLSLSIQYTDAAVERASTTEETLSLWRFDAGKGWRRTQTTLDADRNAVNATVGNLSRNGTVVAVVGEGLAESENGTVESENGTAESENGTAESENGTA